MKVNIEGLKKLIKERFRGNQTWFAEEIGVDSTYLSSILNETKKAESPKVCNAVITYCEKNNLNYRDYVTIM
jgi:hypothetical protein